MSTTYTYPGVYIEELPSGQHTITGVATSIAAFIGWSNQGPVGEAVMVESWPEYETLFGGMIPGVPLAYAVYQFFLNGGSQAYIIRLYNSATAKTASNTIGGQIIYANNPGQWANGLCISVSNVVPGSGSTSTFNLQVLKLTPSGTPALLESFTNLSTDPTNPQWAVAVVDSDSSYITFQPLGGTVPTSWTSPQPSATTNVWIAAGALTTSAQFTSGETVTQTASGTTATVLGTVNGSYLILSSAPSVPSGKTMSSSGPWAGSSASFAPTTVPVAAAVTPLALDGAGTAGVDGTLLKPNTAGFEAQLLNTAAATPPTGYALLGSVPIFNLLCVPVENSVASVSAMQQFCAQYRAFLIVDAAQTAVVGTGSTGLSNTGPAELDRGQPR